jgi:hypothetical protein
MSPRLSFKGYNFGIALSKEVDSIKALVAIITGVNFYTGFDWKTFLLTLAAGTATLAAKLIANAIDFYFKEVELP